MKSMNSNDDHHDPNNTNTNNNWLGFSLSSQIKMDIPHHHDDHDHHHHHHHHQTNPSSSATSVPSPSLFQSPLPHLNNYSIFYNEQNNNNNNGGLYSHHLPLKSDGSLCLMEALTKSQQAMVTTTTTATNSTPKLEDFFGGTNMGTHNYESNNREVMPLSLDSIYYNNAPNNTQNYHLNHQIHPQQQEFHYYHNNNNDSNQQQQVMMMGGISENGGVSSNRMTYGDLKSLTLSMSPGSQSSCINGGHQGPLNVTEISAMEMTKKRGSEKMEQKAVVHRKSIDTFGQRTSQYRGVTRHRWTGRYEAHLWDNSCKKEGQSRKGRQVYLGGYDKEEKAARAYDLAALKYWGPSTHINFPLENYQNELEEMKNMTRQEYVAHLRRKSSGFSRGASMYRGVTRHHQHGRWQARIGRVAGNKDLYLGTFSTQEEAAEAYDVAAIKFRGVNAVTNFDITRYNVERIMSSNTLLSGEMARRKPEAGFANVAASKNLNGGENLMSLYQSSSSSEQLHDVIRMNQRVAVEDLPSAKFCGVGKNHHIMSNASSLATSLTSSREGSPDRICATAEVQPLFALPCAPAASKVLYSDEANNNVGSWVPSTELRASLALPTQMPVFAAWTDA